MGAAISYKYTNTWHTMNIDEGNDDPVACCTYADDAIDMSAGFSDDAITAWQEFFKYRPCILCGNEVMEYLDPDNYNLRDDGTPSLLSGRTHNTVNGRLGVETYEEHWLWNTEKQKIMRIMIEWPRLGIKITKHDNIVSISMTDRPNAPGYSYQAYYLNGVSYDHLYIESNFCHLSNDDVGVSDIIELTFIGMATISIQCYLVFIIYIIIHKNIVISILWYTMEYVVQM